MGISNQKKAYSQAIEPITYPLTERLSVRLYSDRRPNFLETGKLHKGLVLLLDGRELIEEGVGFGVPVVKYADKTFFPGSAQVSVKDDGTLCKTFDLNLVSVKRFWKTTYIDDAVYSPLRKTFQLLYLKHKRLNPVFNKIMELRNLAKIQTEFLAVKSRGTVALTYRCQPTSVEINADFSGLSLKTCQEILLLNEQGASVFQEYQESGGKVISGNRIGAWDLINAEVACLLSPGGLISFGVTQKSGASLFRGWERTNNRFSWAGLSYSLAPSKRPFGYEIKVRCRN